MELRNTSPLTISARCTKGDSCVKYAHPLVGHGLQRKVTSIGLAPATRSGKMKLIVVEHQKDTAMEVYQSEQDHRVTLGWDPQVSER